MPPTRRCAIWCGRGRPLGKARQDLQGFLLRHGRVYRSVRGWTKAYRRWLTTVCFDHPAQQIVLQDYIRAVEDAEARLELERQITELLPAWSMAPVCQSRAGDAWRRPDRRGDGGRRGRRLFPLRQPTPVTAGSHSAAQAAPEAVTPSFLKWSP
jgi:hypothetical protein